MPGRGCMSAALRWVARRSNVCCFCGSALVTVMMTPSASRRTRPPRWCSTRRIDPPGYRSDHGGLRANRPARHRRGLRGLWGGRADWCSTNLGVVLCTECAGCHRALGAHISRVRSCSLDSWPEELRELVEAMYSERLGADEGSATGPNAVWEALMPSWVQRPPPSDTADPGSLEEREAFTRLKYQRKDFCRLAATVLGVAEPARLGAAAASARQLPRCTPEARRAAAAACRPARGRALRGMHRRQAAARAAAARGGRGPWLVPRQDVERHLRRPGGSARRRGPRSLDAHMRRAGARVRQPPVRGAARAGAGRHVWL